MTSEFKITHKGKKIEWFISEIKRREINKIKRREDTWRFWTKEFWKKTHCLEVPISAYRDVRQLLLDLDDTELILAHVPLHKLVSSKRWIGQRPINGKTCDVFDIGEKGKELIELIENSGIVYKLEDIQKLSSKEYMPTTRPIATTHRFAPSSSVSKPRKPRKRKHGRLGYQLPGVDVERIDYDSIFEVVRRKCGEAVPYISEATRPFHETRLSKLSKSEVNIRNPRTGERTKRLFGSIRRKIKSLGDYGIEELYEINLSEIEVTPLLPDQTRIRTTTGEPLENIVKKLFDSEKHYKEAVRIMGNLIGDKSNYDKLSRFMKGLIGGICKIDYDKKNIIYMTIPREFRAYLKKGRLRPEMRVIFYNYIEEMGAAEDFNQEENKHLNDFLIAIMWNCRFVEYRARNYF